MVVVVVVVVVLCVLMKAASKLILRKREKHQDEGDRGKKHRLQLSMTQPEVTWLYSCSRSMSIDRVARACADNLASADM